MDWKLYRAYFLVLFYKHVIGEQVVLLDTTGEASLDWTKYPYGPQASTPGWIEESFTNFQKAINWRSYVVCDVAYNNANNWLWTPFIDREVANRIYIEIKFTIRDCSLFPGNALSCKETFSLLYYEFDAATKEPPPWDAERYKLIGRIAAGEGRFNSNSEVNINTEVKSIPVTKRGVYFAFRDQGACISLLAIKVYYITCPETTINFAKFPATSTGKEITIIEQASGTCVPNAEAVGATPTYLCKGDGKWTLPTGGCKCKAGFQPDMEKQTCNLCTPETFKAEIGDGPCLPCPLHSIGADYGLAECMCINRFYRAPADPKNMSCTQPPTKPQNLTVSFVDQSTVILTWSPPEDLGGRTDMVYRIKCDACTLGSVQYTPNSGTFNETRITISGLNAVTTYRFEVFAENGVSLISNQKPEFADIVVTTDASVASSITNVRVTSVKSTEISLAWDAPPVNDGTDGENDLIDAFEVRWFPKADSDFSNSTSLLTTELSATIKGLQQRTEYGLQIRAKTQSGWGVYSPVIYKTTGQVLNTAYVGDEEGIRLQLVAGGIVAVVVVLVAIIVLTVVFLRSRSNDECNKKQPSDCDTLEYRNTDVHNLDNPPIVRTHTNVTTPLFTGISGSSRTYIDPHTYEDPNQAVREFAREIDASFITIEAILGGGEFGDVCKGKLKMNGADIDVAIKTLKAGSLDKARNDFLTEASIMGQFDHPNVIFLQGVVTKSNPVMIITEYMENGSLDTFLRANDGKFQVLQLVGMLRGNASGMQYLSEMNYVHRDLAARNVLVNSQLICKIADFGLSREIESATEGAYTTRGGKIPVRWTAPEAIAFRKFTSASDVWSMGIVCWEVMSYGERPYWNWSNQDVIKSIEKGYRLPAPMDCPEAIYQLMLDCWQKERTHRPTFQSIVSTLDKLIRVPETLRKIAQNRRLPFNPFDRQPRKHQDIQLSDLSSVDNPHCNTLHRQNQLFSMTHEQQLYKNYHLPDVILFQNYGTLPYSSSNSNVLECYSNFNGMSTNLRRSLLDLEMNRRFNSLFNLNQQQQDGIDCNRVENRYFPNFSDDKYAPDSRDNNFNGESDCCRFKNNSFQDNNADYRRPIAHNTNVDQYDRFLSSHNKQVTDLDVSLENVFKFNQMYSNKPRTQEDLSAILERTTPDLPKKRTSHSNNLQNRSRNELDSSNLPSYNKQFMNCLNPPPNEHLHANFAKANSSSFELESRFNGEFSPAATNNFNRSYSTKTKTESKDHTKPLNSPDLTLIGHDDEGDASNVSDEQFSNNFDDSMLDSSDMIGLNKEDGASHPHNLHLHPTDGAWVTFNHVSTNPLSADAPDLTNFTSVEEWLNSIKMSRYSENFYEGQILSMDDVVNLTVKELTAFGITLVGHQKKIMNSIQNIRAQIRVNGNDGFLV